MEIIERHKKNCFVTSREEYMRQWTDSQTTNTTIEVAAYEKFPYSFFTNINDTHYQWCGPLFLIAQYLGKFTRCKIKVNPFISDLRNVVVKNMMDSTTALFLSSLPGPSYLRIASQKNVQSIVKLSRLIDYTDSSEILASTKKGEYHLFKEFECFQMEVYYGILFSIIVNSIVISVEKNSFKTLFTSSWSYLSVILRGNYNLDHSTSFGTILSGNWLMTCTVIMAAFSGTLRELMIKPKPIDWIDTWNDLHEWTHLKIFVYKLTQFQSFIQSNPNNPMARDFITRTEVIELDQDLDTTCDFNGVRNGKIALVFPSNYLHVLKSNMVKMGLIEDIDFHISLHGDPKPCFVLYSKRNMNGQQESSLDHVIEQLRESGIYNEKMRTGLNPTRLGPDVGHKPQKSSHVFDVLFVTQMKGVFIMYVMVNLIAIISFVIEHIMHKN